jgi:hypothetical protein
VRTLSDGRTIMASCSTGGCIQAGGSLGSCNFFDRYVTAQRPRGTNQAHWVQVGGALPCWLTGGLLFFQKQLGSAAAASE